MTQFKVPRIIPLEYSALDGLHCMGVPDTKILKALQEQRDDTFKDTLGQVLEMLDGKLPDILRKFARQYSNLHARTLVHQLEQQNILIDKAIQTIKQAIEEGK